VKEYSILYVLGYSNYARSLSKGVT
jgi:hypothetical protein